MTLNGRATIFPSIQKILLITHFEWDVCALWAVCGQVSHPSAHRGHRMGKKNAGLNRKWKRLINLSEFTVPLPPFRLHSNWQSQRDKMSYLQPRMEKVLSKAQQPFAGTGLSNHSPFYAVQLYKCPPSSCVMDLCNKTHFLSPYDLVK